MKLLVMRHAEATPGFPDHDRVLSSRGEASLLNPPEDLKLLLESSDRVFVSPYKRTRQTAELLLPERIHESAPWLTPETSVEEVLAQLQHLDDPQVMLISHMPLVGHLTAQLKGDALFSCGFQTAQIEVLEYDYPASGLATTDRSFYLHS